MKLAVIRVRGQVSLRHDMLNTLRMLNLKKKNNCVLVEDTPQINGMIQKIRSLITYGPANEESVKALKTRRGTKTFKLNPPRKGYGRKGIKMSFKQGGAYGDRGEKINDLIMRMV